MFPSIRGCPDGFIALMKLCWQQEAIKRPNLNYVLEKLLEMQASERSNELYQLFDSLSLLPPKLVALTVDYWNSNSFLI